MYIENENGNYYCIVKGLGISVLDVFGPSIPFRARPSVGTY